MKYNTEDNEDFSYTINSEIDQAIPYLDTLISETKKLKKGYFKEIDNNPSLLKLIKFKLRKNKFNSLDYNKKYLNSKVFKKDGYTFTIKIVRTINKDIFNPQYVYQFYSTLKYGKETRDKLLYEEFLDKDQAIKYFLQMEGVFKNLKRRDLIEKIFKDFQNKINS